MDFPSGHYTAKKLKSTFYSCCRYAEASVQSLEPEKKKEFSSSSVTSVFLCIWLKPQFSLCTITVRSGFQLQNNSSIYSYFQQSWAFLWSHILHMSLAIATFPQCTVLQAVNHNHYQSFIEEMLQPLVRASLLLFLKTSTKLVFANWL